MRALIEEGPPKGPCLHVHVLQFRAQDQKYSLTSWATIRVVVVVVVASRSSTVADQL